MQVELIDYMGDDDRVVDAARVSFNKLHSNYSKSDNTRLIQYLVKHNHWSPLAHCIATFRVTAPIFVARQLVKHQIGLTWNEVSRRYIDSEPKFYQMKWRKRNPNKKQGSLDEEAILPPATSDAVKLLETETLMLYNELLEQGVAPEQARAILPLNMYTSWIWTGSLAAWARVAQLRMKPDAQKETRDVVELIAKECAGIWPVSWEALCPLS